MSTPWELWYPPPDSVKVTRYLRANLLCIACAVEQVECPHNSEKLAGEPACMAFVPKEKYERII